MNALLRLEILIARGGVLWPIAATLAVLVLAAAAWSIPQWRAEEARLAAALAEAQQRADAPLAPSARQTSNRERLALFESQLGGRAELDQHLKKIFALAAKRGVQLDLGEYRMSSDAAGGFQRYQAVLPVAGSFGSILSFCQDALIALPFAALEEISFKRETIDAPYVEARLRFVLYLSTARAGPAGAPLSARAEPR
jgi:Tfp pilus assembly protein PilO